MAVSIKKVTLWRTEVENKPGALSSVLAPLAEAGADLQVVMGYHYHGARQGRDRGLSGLGEESDHRRRQGRPDRFRYSHAARPGRQQAGTGTRHRPGHRRSGDQCHIPRGAGDRRAFSAVMGFDDEAASKQATTLIKKAVKRSRSNPYPSPRTWTRPVDLGLPSHGTHRRRSGSLYEVGFRPGVGCHRKVAGG